MHVAISAAKARLTDLVRRAEAGDEVVLTRHGQPTVRMVPVSRNSSAEEVRSRRRAAIDRALAEAKRRGPDGGPSAARSQDYLYGEDGLPA